MIQQYKTTKHMICYIYHICITHTTSEIINVSCVISESVEDAEDLAVLLGNVT